MKIEQIYTKCLAQGAYYIESNGEAVIIDPLRETQPYLDLATENGSRIKYILETHFHADFVSGHVDLANKTGATIVYGPLATTGFDAYIAQDGEFLTVGNLRIQVLHTPGHTMESSCFLLYNEAGEKQAIFTGDTLFLGDVGRPDLAIKTDLSRADLAGHLFDSLRNKIMPLPDAVIVYPGHGAGSACGKNMSTETVGTIGHEKKTNYALRADMSKAEFIQEVTTGLVAPPQYFPKNAMMNKMGVSSIDADFEAIANQENTLILDTRSPQTFKDGFLPKSINIGIDGGFAPWVGALISDLQQAIVFVADEGREKEVLTRLARVGYDNILGYLNGGVKAWAAANKKLDKINSISAKEFEKRQKNEPLTVLDIRKPKEFLSEHIIGAKNFPLDDLKENLNTLDKEQTYYIHCLGGYRSMIGSSILKAAGFDNLVDIAGGFKAIAETEVQKSAFVCPSTL